MPRAERTVTINKPIEEVFAFLNDPAQESRWRPAVREYVVEGEMRHGARIRQKLAAGPFGMPVKADMDVVVYDAPNAVTYQVTTGPLRPRVSFVLTSVDAGTRVDFSIDAPLSGLKNTLMGKRAQKNVEAEAADLDTAKRLLES